MKSKVLIAALMLVTLAAPAFAQRGGGLPPPTPIEKVRGNLYRIWGGGGNTLVLVQKDGVLLVDTKMPNNGQQIVDQVKSITDKPITTIVNTHNHPDHVGSTDFIRERFPNVRIIAHENTKRWVEANTSYKRDVIPTATYQDRMIIGEGDDRVELYYFGVAHTDGDTFVVIPAARAMFLGDIMAWNMAPLIDPPTGGNVFRLADAIETAAKTVKNVDTVIEGHGAVNTWEGYLRFVRFNRALVTAAEAAYKRGDAPEVAVGELQKVAEFAPLLGTGLLKGLEYGNTPRSRAHMNVNVAYQQLSGETVTTNFGAALPATDKHKASDPQSTAAAPRPAN